MYVILSLPVSTVSVWYYCYEEQDAQSWEVVNRNVQRFIGRLRECLINSSDNILWKAGCDRSWFASVKLLCSSVTLLRCCLFPHLIYRLLHSSIRVRGWPRWVEQHSYGLSYVSDKESVLYLSLGLAIVLSHIYKGRTIQQSSTIDESRFTPTTTATIHCITTL